MDTVLGEHGLHPVECRLHVVPHGGIELIVGQFRHQLADPASGVVHPDVDVSERINRPVAQPLDLRAAGHIRRHRQRLRTRPRRHLVQLALPASREHHTIAA